MGRSGDGRQRSRERLEAVVAAAGGRRARAVVLNACILAVAIAAIAVAQGADGGGSSVQQSASREAGDAVELGRRNPVSGGIAAETAIVANAGNDRLALRLTNTADGGRANSSTCENDGTAPTDGCHVYVNKGDGVVASFRSAGSGVAPFAVRNTNDGRVENLNSHYVNNNQVACPEGTQLIGGICAETALRQNNNAIQWPAARQECFDAERRLPSVGESGQILKALGDQAFGAANWTDDTGVNNGTQTAALVLPPNGNTVHQPQNVGVQFRCVTSPITAKPPTPGTP